MLRRIVAMHPAIAILSSWDHYMPPDGNGSEWQVTPASWRRGLRRTYSIALLGRNQHRRHSRNPAPGFDVPACLSRAASGAPFKRRCDYDRAGSLHPPAIAAQNDAARGLRSHRVRRCQRSRLSDGAVLGRSARQHRLPRRRPSHSNVQSGRSADPGRQNRRRRQNDFATR